MAAAYPIPALLDISHPLVLEDGTMDPLWRTFFVQLRTALRDLNFTTLTLQNFANDAAAAAGGIALNQLYRNGSVVQIRVI